jgi:ABC-type branched-subunit amino acid transport system ATPase component/branched-subunit amino acid ABC-type transport system permease component
MSGLGLSMSGTTLLLGLLSGAVYLLVAIGLILVFRASKVINFAIVEAGVLGAAFLALAVTAWHLPYALAFVVAVAVGGAATWIVQVAVVHRLAGVPRVIAVVATVGFAQLFLLLSVVVTPSGVGAAKYPAPDVLPSLTPGGLTLSPAYTAIAIAAPVLTLVVLGMLHRTHVGLGIRATAANRPAARLAGIPVARMTALAWIAAGMLSTVAVALLLPTRGASVGMSLGPNLLLRALTVAVVARFSSIAIAVPAALGLGVLEALVAANVSQQGATEVVLLVVLLAALLLQRDHGGRTSVRDSWSAVTGFPSVGPVARRRLRAVTWATVGVLLVILLILGAFVSNADAARLSRVLAVAVVAMGVLVITGLAGQLSLGQMAIAGIAGAASALTIAATGVFPAGLAMAAAAGALVSLVVGLPALRLRGPFLAATTLALAVVTSGFLLPQLLGSGVLAGQPVIAGFALDTGRRYLLFAVLITAACVVLTAVVRNGRLGRSMRAVRDNEDAARAMGVAAARTKLVGFAVAGVLAGMGGALLAHAQSVVVAGIFPLQGNTDVLAAAVIGGLDVIAGPIIGAFYVVGVPLFVPLDSAGLAATALGWLLLLLYLPRGLPGLVAPLRARIVRGLDEPAVPVEGLPRLSGQVTTSTKAAATLRVHGLTKAYGGVTAVDHVDLDVPSGQVLGLIGANGAGKTTLFELIAGSVSPTSGRVLLDGVDITRLPPERRLSRGIVRSFQDAALFPSMTTLECLQVACSRTPGAGHGRRDVQRRAAAYVERFGLTGYAHLRAGELSTGTRRIVELACCNALEPRLLLLDEPAAGVAQAEVEALSGVLRSVVEALGCTLVVIEHDVAMVRRLADRVIAMHDGRIIADGAADDVLAHPEVVAAYLGDSSPALSRSGATTTPAGA